MSDTTTSVPGARSLPVVVVIGDMGGTGPPDLDRVADRVDLRFALTTDELDRVIAGAEVGLVWDFRSSLLSDSLSHAGALRWVHVAGAGVDAVLTPGLRASDILLTNARGVFDHSIAETVAGMILVFAKDLLKSLELQRQRVWMHRETEMLSRSSALVVGAGGIGREIGRVLGALAVDVRIVGTRQRPDAEFGVIHSVDNLCDLLPEADYVVLVAPLTDRTRRLFATEEFRLMKPSARFINVGRGELVDEGALVAALQDGEIAGAALDVFEVEPLPADHQLWAMPQVIITPHMSADFHGWLEALADQFVENLERWLDGETLDNVVDKGLGYRPGSP